jgi:DNA-binding response OmpR family regulator
VRILFIGDPRRQSLLIPGLKNHGLMIESEPALDSAGFKLETRSYDAVLFDGMAEEVEATLPCWRRKGIKAHIIALLPHGCSALDRAHCLDAGSDVSLTHPINIEELCAHLRALRRRDHSTRAPVQRVHDLEINREVRSVCRAGKAIHLTPREFDLLQLLATNQGKVMTLSMIRERLYERRENSYSNIVAVYIRYLRSKIDEGFDTPLILTRWGQGYLMRPEEATSE